MYASTRKHFSCTQTRSGQVVGFIGVVKEKIEMLFIHPLWRGRGIGRRLLEYAVKILGATKVDVNEQNQQALGFYLRMGFEVKGRSSMDSMGKPFPLLHLHLRDIATQHLSTADNTTP